MVVLRGRRWPLRTISTFFLSQRESNIATVTGEVLSGLTVGRLKGREPALRRQLVNLGLRMGGDAQQHVTQVRERRHTDQPTALQCCHSGYSPAGFSRVGSGNSDR